MSDADPNAPSLTVSERVERTHTLLLTKRHLLDAVRLLLPVLPTTEPAEVLAYGSDRDLDHPQTVSLDFDLVRISWTDRQERKL